jgi:hypothetical protein
VLSLSRRARYFSLYPFLLAEFERLRLSPSPRVLSRFFKLREYEYALAVKLCERPGCGRTAPGVNGSQSAGPQARRHLEEYPRSESVESHMGGYGLFYRTPLIELGAVAAQGTPLGDEGSTPIDVLRPSEAATALADAFRARLAGTLYYRRYFTGSDPVPAAALRELSERACLCRLDEAGAERAALRRLILGEVPEQDPEAREQRRRSFALFLTALSRRPEAFQSRSALDEAHLEELAGAGAEGPRAEVAAQWAALVVKEVVQDALSTIWSEITNRGLATQPPDGMEADDLQRFLHDELAAADAVELPGVKTLDWEPSLATVVLADRIDAAAAGLSLEQVRVWLRGVNEAVAGLAVLLLVARRLPTPTGAALSAWRAIGIQRSENQPGLLGLLAQLEDHLAGGPVIAETLEWLVRRYVIAAHERIAYSKLPEFTFRFRLEGGRLRFYPNAPGRFILASNRQEALALLCEDLGYCRRTERGAEPTDDGLELVAAVFG